MQNKQYNIISTTILYFDSTAFDFETRDCAHDGGSTSPAILGAETITSYEREDRNMLSTGVGL